MAFAQACAGPFAGKPAPTRAHRPETTRHLDSRAGNLFVLAFKLQSEKRFSLVGQFDKRPSRFLVLWLLNN